MTSDDQVERLATVDADDHKLILRLAAVEGVEVRELPRRAIDPVTAVTLALLGSSVAVATVTHLVDQAKGGQVIDLRPGAPKMIYRSTDLVYGLVAVLLTDGTISIQVAEPRGMLGQVLDTLRGLLTDLSSATADQAADTLREAVGDKATVSRV